MNILKIIAVALVPVLVGCRRQRMPQYDPALETMAAHMDSVHWDGRCPAVEAINPAALHTRADSALYSLLAYAHLKRSHVALPADSLIATASDFYANGREPRRAMLAWYFRACSNWDAGRYADAVYYALNMRPYAEQLADTLYLIRFCDIMASSFAQTNNILEAARYYNKALEYSRAKPDVRNWNYPYFARAAFQGWDFAGYSDSTLIVFRENAPELLRQATDTAEMRELVMIYHTAVRTVSDPDFAQIARDYDVLDANPLAHHIIEATDWLRLERDYYRAHQRNPRAIDSLLVLLDAVGIDTFNLQHPVAPTRFPNVVQAQQTYLNEQAAARLEHRTRLMLLWGAISLAVLIIGGVGFYRLRLRRKEAERLALIDEVREMSVRREADKSLAHKLFAQRLQEVNLLCDNYYNHRDTGEKAKSIFYREFEARIAGLGSKETIAEIESLVNECKDNIVARLRSELPGLKEHDVNLLTYIYAGFAARSICIFMGISKDNYYMRRRRIKSRLASAPSHALFIAEMD